MLAEHRERDPLTGCPSLKNRERKTALFFSLFDKRQLCFFKEKEKERKKDAANTERERGRERGREREIER
jgi:hypothetical protein